MNATDCFQVASKNRPLQILAAVFFACAASAVSADPEWHVSSGLYAFHFTAVEGVMNKAFRRDDIEITPDTINSDGGSSSGSQTNIDIGHIVDLGVRFPISERGWTISGALSGNSAYYTLPDGFSFYHEPAWVSILAIRGELLALRPFEIQMGDAFDLTISPQAGIGVSWIQTKFDNPFVVEITDEQIVVAPFVGATMRYQTRPVTFEAGFRLYDQSVPDITFGLVFGNAAG